MRKPSIVFLNRVYPPTHGASGRVLRDLARSMAQDGWQVSVVTSGEQAVNERDGGVRVIRVKGRARPRGVLDYLVVWFRMFLATLKLRGVDVIVTMTDPPMMVTGGAMLSRFKKTKHIHWCQDVYPDLFKVVEARIPDGIRRFLAKRVYAAMNGADKVIVIGRCMARHLGMRGVQPKTMAVVPNWPDAELALPAGKNVYSGAPHHADIEKSLKERGQVNGYRSRDEQIKDGPKFRVLYAGNIGKAHPVDTILEAAVMLHDEHPEIEFVFVGDGPRYDDIAEMRSRKHMDNVKLLPYQPARRLRELMESGDVHLISMHDQALGMLVPSKLYSALAAGRPCIYIGPMESETSKVISDYAAGDIIRQGDSGGLVRSIKAFRMDADTWFAAQSGAAKAGAIFTPQASIHAWIERAWQVLDGGDFERPAKPNKKKRQSSAQVDGLSERTGDIAL